MKFILSVLHLVFLCSLFASQSNAIVHGPGKETFRNVVVNDASLAISYEYIAEFLLPTVAYQELVRNGAYLQLCTAEQLNFTGTIDRDDFQIGHVITFPLDSTINPHCLLTGDTNQSQLWERDEVAFRRITDVSFYSSLVTVRTEFISGALVVPEVNVSITGPAQLRNLDDIEDGVSFEIEQSGTVPVVEGADIDWSVGASGGVSNFKFSRTQLRVTWDQSLQVKASATLNVSKAFQNNATRNIFNIGIPHASIDIKILFLGSIKCGFFLNLDYEIDTAVTMKSVMGMSASYRVGHRVTVGLQAFKTEALEFPTEDSTIGGFTTDSGDATSFQAEGFVGIRPSLQAQLSLPILGQSFADVGATVGVNAFIGFESVPFNSFDGKQLFGDCSKRHHVRGQMQMQGRRLGSKMQLARSEPKEFIIADPFFEKNLGTICLFPSN